MTEMTLEEAIAEVKLRSVNGQYWPGSYGNADVATAILNAVASGALIPASEVLHWPAHTGDKETDFDNDAVYQFARMMRTKMGNSRAKGRTGWNDPSQCSPDYLRTLLYEHIYKGDPVDVANICMMLRHYQEATTPKPSDDLRLTSDARLAVALAYQRAADVARIRAEQHADMALNGDPESARFREAMEAAFTDMRWAILALADSDDLAEVAALRREIEVTNACNNGLGRLNDVVRERAEAAEAQLAAKETEAEKLREALTKTIATSNGALDATATEATLRRDLFRVREELRDLIWPTPHAGDEMVAALQETEKPPTDYEVKLSQLKKDFPNGI